MSDAFQIRRASKADAREIARVHVAASRGAYRGIYTDEYLEALSVEHRAQAWIAEGKGHLATDDPDIAVLVALKGGQMFGFADVGAATSSKLSGHAELHAIYVDPTFARRGAGQALFRACVDHARSRGFEAMITKVLSRNTPARSFYERMQGELMPSTERLMVIGRTKDQVEVYRWRALALTFASDPS